MLRRLDAVPGVAGDDPAVRRFVLERVHVFGLARQQADHFTALEQATRVAFAHKLGQVGTEQHVEDRIRLGVGQGLHHATRIDLAQRGRLLGHKLHIGLGRLKQLLERGHSRLTILVVGVHQRPALFLEGRCLGHHHRHLHVGGGTQTVGIAVAVLPDDLVGQWLTGQEEEFLLLGKVGQRQPDVREERAREHIDLFARHQFFGSAHGVARVGVVVADDELDLLAQHPTRCVDLIDRQLHAFLVGLQEGGLRLVAVDLANLDDILGVHHRGQRECQRGCGRGTHEVSSHRHGETPERWVGEGELVRLLGMVVRAQISAVHPRL
ncbi:hypothetical protein D3C71_885510 [compost metagenome]